VLLISSRTKPALLATALLLSSAAAVGAEEAATASTYQTSCRHIGGVGRTLFAECRRANGAYKQTDLPIAGIENDNGSLRFTSMYKASTFQDNCGDIEVAVTILSARCRRIDGGFIKTSIPIPGIVNIDGDLRYRH
jgi:hypothetical protein